MDKTSFIVVTICVILLFLTWPGMPQQPAATQSPQSQTQTSTPSTPQKASAETVQAAPLKTAPLKEFPIQTLESDGLILTFDKNGSGIASAEFKKHLSEDKKSNYTIDASASPFLSIKSTVTTDIAKSGNTVTIDGVIKNTAMQVRRTLVLNDENPYLINGELQITNNGKVTMSPGAILFNAGSMSPLSPEKTGFMYSGDNNQQISYKEQEGDVDELTLGKIKDMNAIARHVTENIDWLAVENRYFCTILTPEIAFDAFSMETADIGSKEAKSLSGFGQLSVATIQPGQSVTVKFNAYIGPKQFSYLSTLGQGQEDILDLGWSFIRPLSKLVLKMLGILSGIGYGLAIILITLLIKTLFWPITHKSQVSMRKMSELQPVIKELKAKYKDNPQMMQMKTMEAYRANKVNPLGGCLPMLIQIPVFFALYSTFRSAVELRHVSFLWCADLARPDTIATIFSLAINPLALIMVFSMLAQQMLTPTTGDPNQKKMMMIMPLIMLLFMYNMPAALTLYWTVNQFISIIQQYYTNRSIKKKKQA